MRKSFNNKLFLLIIVAGLIMQLSMHTVIANPSIPIYTQEDLARISQNLRGNFVLMNDITITGEWDPIGSSNERIGADFNGFKGVFDGNGFTIRNLRFNISSNQLEVGLFKINEGTIKNLRIEDSSISGDLLLQNTYIFAGFIAAVNYGRIENCHNAGNITLNLSGSEYTYATIGGLVGAQRMSSITEKSSNSGNISVKAIGVSNSISIGGIAGSLGGIGGFYDAINGSKITHSYNTGRISGESDYVMASGIASGGSIIEYSYNTGDINATSGNPYNGYRSFASGISTRETVNECFNIGTIIGYTHAGGIVAQNGHIGNSFNAGNISSDFYAGGIAGDSSNNPSTIMNSYNSGLIYGRKSDEKITQNNTANKLEYTYFFETSANVDPNDISSLTETQVSSKENYKGFDFDSIWSMSSDPKYPFPILKKLPSPTFDTNGDFVGGNGTIYNPFKISTKKQLDKVREYSNASFILVNNISFDSADFSNSGDYYNNGNGWIPLFSDGNSFTGTFDGSGYTISNLYINATGMGGLFRFNDGGIISNLGVVNGDITVIGSGAVAGGIVAVQNAPGLILNCYYTGNISVTTTGNYQAVAGGICGTSGSSIKKCYSSATITSRSIKDGKDNTHDVAGGIVGNAYGNAYQFMSDLFFSGHVTGSNVGGIVGFLGSSGKVTNTINIGTQSGKHDSRNGAIAGQIFGASVLNSYYNNNRLPAVADVLGTVEAKYLSTNQFKQISSFPGFDFYNVWMMDEDMSHPVLIGMPSPSRSQLINNEELPSEVSALPTSSKVLVNNTPISFEAYNIGNNNYFKLRDIAKVVSDTKKQFEVIWDTDKKAIKLISSKPYTVVGGELSVGQQTTETAILNKSTIYIDDKIVALTAYTIKGNNYFKLRDLAQAFDFGVTWDGSSNTVVIDTSINYSTD